MKPRRILSREIRPRREKKKSATGADSSKGHVCTGETPIPYDGVHNTGQFFTLSPPRSKRFAIIPHTHRRQSTPRTCAPVVWNDPKTGPEVYADDESVSARRLSHLGLCLRHALRLGCGPRLEKHGRPFDRLDRRPPGLRCRAPAPGEIVRRHGEGYHHLVPQSSRGPETVAHRRPRPFRPLVRTPVHYPQAMNDDSSQERTTSPPSPPIGGR